MGAVIELLRIRKFSPAFRHVGTSTSSLAIPAGTGGSLVVNSGGVQLPDPGNNEALRIVRADVSLSASVAGGIVVDSVSVRFAAILPGPLFLSIWDKGAVTNNQPIWGPNIAQSYPVIGEETSECFYGDEQLGALTSSTPSGFALCWNVGAHNGSAGAITLFGVVTCEWEMWRTDGPTSMRVGHL